MRDHYEGTPFDMTKGIDAGPFGCPLRSRPLEFTVDSVQYGWERPISTQQTAYSFVSQSRSWLPDRIGGVYWYGLDDTYMTCYTPLYCGIDAIPESFTAGSFERFSWKSAWWVFNLVSNYSYLKYSMMSEDVLAVQKEIEGTYLALQPAVEKTAMELAENDPDLLVRYLTDYSVSHAEQMVSRWRALGEYLLTKYNDGYVRDENGRPQQLGYPESWLRDVLKSKADQLRLEKVQTITP
jgi:dipeptidase